MKVLIAEDDPTSRQMLAGILGKWGYETIIATDGLNALAILRKPDAPRLAILDWMMPGMEGIEVCRCLRSHAAASPSYLILLTARDSKDDIIRGLEAGANDYLSKPFNPQELHARIDIGRRMVSLQDQLVARVEELQRAEKRLEDAWNLEIRVAGRIQQSLLVGHPPGAINGVRIGTLSIPSRQVDGDFFDVFPLGLDSLDIVIGDVMGKGIQAAMLGAGAKGHILRVLNGLLLSGHDELPRPREIVGSLHAAMSRELMAIESFLTLCYARICVREQKLLCVDCGHTGILHWRAPSGDWRIVRGTNMPIGFHPAERFDEVSAEIAPGDVLVFFSDGITEAARADGERFGEPRLMQSIEREIGNDPKVIVNALHRDLVAFAGDGGFADDISCVVASIEPESESLRLAVKDFVMTSDMERLTDMRAALKAFLALDALRSLSERERDMLVLALQEAATNIIVHAYRRERGRPLDVRFEAFPNALRVTLSHVGDAFVPAPTPFPSADGSQDGGYGMRMIEAAVDSCNFGRDATGRNQVTLNKFIHQGD